MLHWSCVHIEHMRLTRALQLTFHSLLLSEYETEGRPPSCSVYFSANPDGSYTYFFCPRATLILDQFLRFWEATSCPEPANLLDLSIAL
jgi:hypothetical protein